MRRRQSNYNDGKMTRGTIAAVFDTRKQQQGEKGAKRKERRRVTYVLTFSSDFAFRDQPGHYTPLSLSLTTPLAIHNDRHTRKKLPQLGASVVSGLTVPAPSHPAAAAANHQRRRREEEHDLSTRTANTHTHGQGTHKAYALNISLLLLTPSRRQPQAPCSFPSSHPPPLPPSSSNQQERTKNEGRPLHLCPLGRPLCLGALCGGLCHAQGVPCAQLGRDYCYWYVCVAARWEGQEMGKEK